MQSDHHELDHQRSRQSMNLEFRGPASPFRPLPASTHSRTKTRRGVYSPEIRRNAGPQRVSRKITLESAPEAFARFGGKQETLRSSEGLVHEGSGLRKKGSRGLGSIESCAAAAASGIGDVPQRTRPCSVRGVTSQARRPCQLGFCRKQGAASYPAKSAAAGEAVIAR